MNKRRKLLISCMALILIIVSWLLFFRYSGASGSPATVTDEEDYFLIARNTTMQDMPYFKGAKLMLVSDEKEQMLVKMTGIDRGFSRYNYENGYLYYMQDFSSYSSSTTSGAGVKRSNLYIHDVQTGRTVKKIENVKGYIPVGERVIYKTVIDRCYFYHLKKGMTEEIIWKERKESDALEDYVGLSLYNIRQADNDHIYILGDDGKSVYSYDFLTQTSSLVYEGRDGISGIIPHKKGI